MRDAEFIITLAVRLDDVDADAPPLDYLRSISEAAVAAAAPFAPVTACYVDADDDDWNLGGKDPLLLVEPAGWPHVLEAVPA